MDWIFFRVRRSFRTDDSVFAKTAKLPKRPRFIKNRLPAETSVGRIYIEKRYYETITVSAAATGYVNAFAHREVIGDSFAVVLAILIVVFVERFYFVLRHGLTTVYQAGKQRFYALLCYRAIQLTMILNACIFAAWIAGFEVPEILEAWSRWALAVHFALALVGVQAVRDSDAVVENRMLELKAATAAQDVITAQKTAAIGSPLVLLAAKTRGFFDACNLAIRLLFRRGGLAQELLAEIDAISPKTITAASRRPGFVNNQGDALD